MAKRQETTGRGEFGAMSRRSGFTLVELLVVIMIIAMLAGLVVPAVMRSQTTARNARIKAEIDMLHTAMMNYKNEYGSFPPCVTGTTSKDVSHLTRLFPRMPAASANAQLALASTGVSGSVTDTSCLNTIASLSPRTALTFWLSGYTPDPASPLYPNSSRKALFSFDTSRKAQNSSKRFTGEYSAPGNPDAQYWYMDSTSSAAELATFSFAREIDPSTGLAFNQDTFQIVNPGSDGSWGTDDDLSNFWPGTRKEYSSSSNK